jgi:hypothetical protein
VARFRAARRFDADAARPTTHGGPPLSARVRPIAERVSRGACERGSSRASSGFVEPRAASFCHPRSRSSAAAPSGCRGPALLRPRRCVGRARSHRRQPNRRGPCVRARRAPARRRCLRRRLRRSFLTLHRARLYDRGAEGSYGSAAGAHPSERPRDVLGEAAGRLTFTPATCAAPSSGDASWAIDCLFLNRGCV